MKENRFKTKLIVFSARFALFLINGSSAIYKAIFAKRTILFVTKQKIRSLTFGPLSQACLLLFFGWVTHLFIQSLEYNRLVNEKSGEIARLNSTSSYFKEELETANEKLKKINEYLIILTGSSHNVKAIQQDDSRPRKVKEDDLSSKDKQTMQEIKNADRQFAEISSITRERIKKLESAISLTGLNVKKKNPTSNSAISGSEDSKTGGKGGPAEDYSAIDKALESVNLSGVNDDLMESRLEKARFVSEIDHLITLEKLVNAIPLARPMKNYYVSSGFGYRTDPITGRKAVHHGLDFVGVNHEKVISPSRGKVVLAGKFSDYGNAVVIDHGYGITTRYGHLFALKVKQGQIVQKGEVIALQGSTGRSTGAHLHYEVRYKNIPLNPKKFLEAGDLIDSLPGKKDINYANS